MLSKEKQMGFGVAFREEGFESDGASLLGAG